MLLQLFSLTKKKNNHNEHLTVEHTERDLAVMLKQSRNAFAMQFDSRKSTAFLIAFNLQKVFHLCRAINTTTPAAALDISLHGDSDRLKEIQGSKTKVIIHLQNRLVEIEGLNTYQLSQRVNKWRQNSTAI